MTIMLSTSDVLEPPQKKRDVNASDEFELDEEVNEMSQIILLNRDSSTTEANWNRSLLPYLYINSRNLRVYLSFFWKNSQWISLKLCHSLLSTALWGFIYKLNVLLRLFIYKMRIWSKFTCFCSNS